MAWGLEGTRVGFSATSREREERLADTTNGADQVLITIWRLTSAQVKSRGYNNASLSTKPLSSVAGGYVYGFCYGDLARGDKVNVGAVKVSCPWFKPAIVDN